MAKLSVIFLIGCAAAPGFASAAGLDALALAIRPTAPAPEAVGGGGDVTLKAESLESKLEFDFTAGQPAERTRWSTGRLGLRQAWTPAANLSVLLDARSQSRSDRDAFSERRSGEADAHLSGRYSPLSAVEVQLGAGAHRTETSAVASRDRLERDASDVSASLAWRLKRLTLEGGGRMETVNLGWRKADAPGGRGGYVMSEPRLDGRLGLWDGAALRFGATRAAVQLGADEVATLADAAAYRPDQEWRYETGFNQALGAAQLQLGLTLARREVLGAELVSSERRQVETALSAPVQIGPGGPLKLSARAAWRRSALSAPATGGVASELGAYDAEVALDQSLHGLAWGVSARASGPSETYRMGERVSQAAGSSVSGFLAYRPGPVAIRLDAHALAEGERTRQSWGGLPLVERQRGVERRLHLTLVKAL